MRKNGSSRKFARQEYTDDWEKYFWRSHLTTPHRSTSRTLQVLREQIVFQSEQILRAHQLGWHGPRHLWARVSWVPVGPRARARLVVLGIEVAGRWSEEARQFVGLLAKAKARREGWLLRRRAEQAWRMRWSSLIAGSVAPRPSGADGDTPLTHDVEQDFQHVDHRMRVIAKETGLCPQARICSRTWSLQVPHQSIFTRLRVQPVFHGLWKKHVRHHCDGPVHRPSSGPPFLPQAALSPNHDARCAFFPIV